MKCFIVMISMILGILIPMLFLTMPVEESQKVQITTESTFETVETAGCVANIPEITIMQTNGSFEKMSLEEYIVCVVLKEMPADFEYEALKAQAVVARTYTLRKMDGTQKHGLAPVCTEPSCCQGYCTQEEYLLSGGKKELLDNVVDAVNDTAGMVLTYAGELIEATYFSCSGGMTEDAVAVWGSDIPYLKATESPGEENATHFTDTETFSLEELSSRLNLEPVTPGNTWIESVTYTNGGGVSNIKICGKNFSGTQIRQLLGIRSTAFKMTVVGNNVVITTKGYGHRVGMSQYGADAMAVQGKNYEEILKHYYRDTALVHYETID